MEAQQDFRDLLALFNKNNVDYIIVGAYALGFHGAPRYTGDLDILVSPDSVNAGKIMQALLEFGFGSLAIKASDFEIYSTIAETETEYVDVIISSGSDQ